MIGRGGGGEGGWNEGGEVREEGYMQLTCISRWQFSRYGRPHSRMKMPVWRCRRGRREEKGGAPR